MTFLFGRQWFPPNTQLAIDHELDQFWFLFKKGEFDRSISFINQFIYHSNEAKKNKAFRSYCSRLKGLVDFYQPKPNHQLYLFMLIIFGPALIGINLL